LGSLLGCIDTDLIYLDIMVDNLKEDLGNNQTLRDKNGSFLKTLLIPAIVSLIVALITSLITLHLKIAHEHPDIQILGALPINLYEPETREESLAKFRNHKLGFIFKVKNSSPTETIVHTAIFEGCVPIDPYVAEMHFHSFEENDNRTAKEISSGKYKDSVQRIRAQAGVRQNSKIIFGYGISYVGVVFILKPQGAYLRARNSVSLKGNCEEIRTPNPDPSLFQVFEIRRTYFDLPRELRPEFRDGRLTLSLLVGDSSIIVPPQKIKRLRSIRLQNWDTLAFPQMYENPDTSYPPLQGK